MCVYIYIYIYIYIHKGAPPRMPGPVSKPVPASLPLGTRVRPVRLLRVWISEGLTQTNS